MADLPPDIEAIIEEFLQKEDGPGFNEALTRAVEALPKDEQDAVRRRIFKRLGMTPLDPPTPPGSTPPTTQ